MSPADLAASDDRTSGSDAVRPVLDVSGVAVTFGGVSALADVSLTVEPATITGLIGPNGAGKTTLFNVISGIQRPDHGRVLLDGRDLAGLAPYRRARLGIARTFQRLEVFGSLSACENVQVGLEATVKWWQWRKHKRTVLTSGSAPPVGDRGDASPGPGGGGGGGSTETVTEESRREHRSRVVRESLDLLDGVGLGGLAEQQASAMTTGNARMVELARALSLTPRLLLLDEPGSGLDEHESEALGSLLRRLSAEGVSILLVEHDMELIMRVCDRIHVLDFGQIIASGTPDEIRRNELVQAAYLGTAQVVADGVATALGEHGQEGGS